MKPHRGEATATLSSETTKDFELTDLVANANYEVRGVWAESAIASGTWDLRISEASGWTDDDLDERYTNTGMTALVLAAVMDPPIPIKADAEGKLHLRVDTSASYTGSIAVKLDLARAG